MTRDDDWVAMNAAAMSVAEAALADAQAKVDAANQRFQCDPRFHAAVYAAARYLVSHVLPPEREHDDREGRWQDALMSALAVVAIVDPSIFGSDTE